MWRMFRAAILGVLIGIVGGVIFGQVSYVKKYKDKVSREIMADAVMYNNSLDDSGRVIRLKVDYDGDMKSEDERDELESYVGNMVMKQIGMWLGDDYNENLSYIQMRHNLVMAMEDINDIAQSAANAWGVDADASSGFSYEYFGDSGEDCPPNLHPAYQKSPEALLPRKHHLPVFSTYPYVLPLRNRPLSSGPHP